MIKKRIIIALILLIAIMLALFLLLENSKKNALYAKLENINIDNISLTGLSHKFSIKNGHILEDSYEIKADSVNGQRVLRLILFYQWFKEDPILFDPYINNDEYEKAALKYHQSMDIFLKTIDGQKISPVLFIEKFGQSSVKFQKFEQNISEQEAEDFLDSIKNAQDAYISDATEIEKSFQSLNQYSDYDKKIGFIGGETYTSVPMIIDDIELIKKNGKLLKEEILNREKCLIYDVYSCVRPANDFSAPVRSSAEIGTPNVLPMNILEISNTTNLAGPYRINSSCWNKRNYQWLFMADVCLGSEDKSACPQGPYLADNKYFNSVAQGNLFKELNDNGVKMSPMGVTNAYTCNDLQYYAQLNTVDYSYKTYENDRFFDSIDDKQGKEAEELFFDKKYPSQDDLDYLSSYYLYFYNNNKSLLTDAQKDELLRRGIIGSRKLIKMPSVIDYVGMFADRANAKFTKSGNMPQKIYLYVTKSAYSVLFFNFSSSVWRSNDKLHLIDFDASNAEIFKMNNQEFMSFEKANLYYGQDVLVEWITQYRNFQNSIR